VVEETLAAYLEWQAAREAAVGAASTPSIDVATASRWAAGGLEAPVDFEVADVEVLQLAADRDERPSGPVFGALVHAVLAGVPLDAEAEAVHRAATAHGRLLGASEVDASAASALAVRVLAHPILARARASARTRREVPVILASGPGSLVEGVADLAFLQDGAWTVVDFKTDVEIGRVGLDAYRRQIGFYATAIARATGLPATGVLLRI
jgi:ATP-dependent exoDNAse (exonuclease V) beta subunit